MSIEIPEFSDILNNVKLAFTNSLGSDLNFDPSTPTGQLVNEMAASYQSLYQLLQAAYSASRADQAQGTQLDDLVALLNIKRTDGKQTICKSCTLTGTNTTVIPVGAKAKTTDGIIFQAAQDIPILGTTGTGNFVSEDTGMFTVATGALTQIVDTQTGWNAITNPSPGVEGSDSQTDDELRSYVLSRSQNLAMGYEGAIKAFVEGVSGVLQCYVYVNYSNSVSPAPWTSPPNSLTIVIHYPDQGINADIAEAIFVKIPPVTTFNGFTPPLAGTRITENVDITGQSLPINWTQADETPVNFVVDIVQQSSFTADDEQKVKDAIKDYFSDNALISGEIEYLKIVATIVDSVPTASFLNIYMSTNVNPQPTDVVDITANFWEIFVVGDIEVDYGS